VDSPAETPTHSRPHVVARPPFVRVAVLGVVLAGAIALGLASVMSGYGMGGPPLFATLVAVAGGITWLYAPRLGYWLLLLDGLAVVVPAGIGLATGAVPWVLVGFWGGSAILLAAVLHLIIDSSPGRATTATLVAVISLLVLSALGLAQYVQANWAPTERTVLLEIPPLTTAAAGSRAAWVETCAPAPGGGWRCAWVLQGPPPETRAQVRAALERDGWAIATSSAGEIVADKGSERLAILIAENPDGLPGAPAGSVARATQVTATVSRAPGAAFR
jgi:hypothetical protein